MAYTTIDNPELYFQTKLYTGTQNSHAITLDGSENMQPDWVWIKCRDDTHNHQVFDSVRGVHERMRTDTTGAETTSNESLKSFDSDGFTLGTQQNVNASANNDNSFVAWNWKAGGSASSNSDGSITSSVSANQDAGFSIVSYTGTGSAGTVGHGLSATPKMIIAKNRSDVQFWAVYHASLSGANKYLVLDQNSSAQSGTAIWNSTHPTSSVFSVANHGTTNENGDDIIAYCFAEKKGFSKFSSFVGNGNDDGSYIHLGFKPAFILLKNTSVSASWLINDNKRNGFNPNSRTITPNNSEVENTGTDRTDFLSNGFKLRVGSSTAWNGSGNTISYMAFAESPFVTSTGIPTTAR